MEATGGVRDEQHLIQRKVVRTKEVDAAGANSGALPLTHTTEAGMNLSRTAGLEAWSGLPDACMHAEPDTAPCRTGAAAG
jgi:hypothetical protein